MKLKFMVKMVSYLKGTEKESYMKLNLNFIQNQVHIYVIMNRMYLLWHRGFGHLSSELMLENMVNGLKLDDDRHFSRNCVAMHPRKTDKTTISRKTHSS